MPRNEVQLVGFDRLGRTMHSAAADLQDLSPALRAAGQTVADYARVIAPRVTGRLAATIRAETDRDSFRVVGGSATVPYALVIHNGWPAHNISPNPYVTRATEATEPIWHEQLTEGVRDDVSHIKGV